MEQDVHMLLEGTIAELIIKLEPRLYKKYIWKNKHDKPILYIKLKRHYLEHYKQLYCFGNYCPIH